MVISITEKKIIKSQVCIPTIVPSILLCFSDGLFPFTTYNIRRLIVALTVIKEAES